MDIAYVDEKLAWAHCVIMGVLGTAYLSWHIYLTRKGHGLSKVVWCVSALWMFSFLSSAMEVIVAFMQPTIQTETPAQVTGVQRGLFLLLALLKTCDCGVADCAAVDGVWL